MQKTNKVKLHRIILLLGLMSVSSLIGQDNGEGRLGSWFMYFGTNTLSEKISIHSEAQFRYYEVADNFNQLLLRTGLNYHLNPEAIATLGYGYIGTDGTFTELPGDMDSREHRIFEQFILKNEVGNLKVEHRYRLEQRFLEMGPSTDTQHRARYRLQLTLPMGNRFFLNAYDEIFVNLQDEAFGQNRAYLALGIHLSQNSSLQIGYLKNHFPNANYDRLQLGIFFNPDLRKNQGVPES
jgi:hypothetical protein